LGHTCPRDDSLGVRDGNSADTARPKQTDAPGFVRRFESLDHVKVDGAQGTADSARTKRYGIRLRWHFVTAVRTA